jgi:hypothetical protein
MVRAGSHGRRSRRVSFARGFLVAALLAAACSPPPKNGAPPPTTPLEGIAPSGDVTLPLTFSWRGNAADGLVRVSIEDRAQRPVFDFPARGSSGTARGLEAVLTPGEPFSWTVASIDENGNERRRSAPLRFTPSAESTKPEPGV